MKILRHIGTLAFVSFFLVSCQQLKVGKTNSNSQQQYDRTDVQGYLLPDMAGRLLSAKIQRISLGDTKTKVIRILGRRTDEGHLDAWLGPPDDPEPERAKLAHPELHFLHWKKSGVSVYVDFTMDDKVYRIRYYDGKLSPNDGPYIRKKHNKSLQPDRGETTRPVS